MLTNPPKKIAIVHDWLLGFRGGEEVLSALTEIYPTADIFTLFYREGSVSPQIEMHKITTSFLNKLPLVHKYYRHLLPLMPLAIEKLDLSSYDLVISSSHCVAKGIIPAPGALHVCYVHTPIRYAWDRYNDYFKGSKLEFLIYPIIHYLRLWDTASSQRVDHFIANSHWVQKRIQRFYRRPATVIHPFVNLKEFFPVQGDRGDYYLVVSAFAPYKRIDLAIQACEKMGRKLLVVGDGQDATKLKTVAGPHTQFLGRVSGEDLRELMGGAKALLFPGEEDFGITPVQTMACGTPVIAYGRGGALDTVIDNTTGILFSEQSVDSLVDAIEEFERKAPKFGKETLVKHAARFSRDRFKETISKMVQELWASHSGPKMEVQAPTLPLA